MTILDSIAADTRNRVIHDKQRLPLTELIPRIPPIKGDFPFESALAKPDVGFICEVKRASPSKGLIAADFPYLEIAREYQSAGAAAISVLTEPKYFQGQDIYLEEIRQVVTCPLLRKDFVVDEYQLYQAAMMGADAILLICSLLEPLQLREYLQLADELGLSCLVEAHDESEVEMALKAGSRVIGVNNRDLKTFQVDMENSIRLRKLAPESVLFVSESGITTPEDVAVLRDNGVAAVLIGETLMRSQNISATLSRLWGDSL